ncbi:LOW QUALITY PROTEIN: zinc-binding protein A33-like [Rhinoraja longicauda]
MERLAADVSFREELQCPICLELFADPVILGCGHNFCRDCVRQFWRRRDPAPCCPECREPVEPDTWRPNRAARRLSEVARARADLYCDQHSLRLKLFCHTDRSLICLGCRDSPDHRDHQASPTNEAAPGYKVGAACTTLNPTSPLNNNSPTRESHIDTDKTQVELEHEMAVVQDRSAAFSHLLCSEQDKVTVVKVPTSLQLGSPDVQPWDALGRRRSYEQLQLHIGLEFAQMHGFLREREESLAEELAVQEACAQQQIVDNLQKVQQGLDALDSQLVELQRCRALENDMDFLKAMCKLRPEDVPMPSETPTVLPLGVFKGPLQYKVWREMKDFISPVPAALTLDASSAHHKLLLTEDLCGVCLTDSRQHRDEPTCQRFLPCVNVLAEQSFSGGRHYWEVEVGSKTAWDLGVARGSVCRKGRLTLSPTDGYWTIWLRDGHSYKALDRTTVPMYPPAQPNRVGIYLDYDGGQVSFYNADNMSHLYTFTDTFTESLYPYFSPYLNCAGNSQGLTLCRLQL